VSGSVLRQLSQQSPAVADEPPPELVFKRKLTFRSAIRDLWAARELVRSVSERNIRVRYKRAVLGVLWAVMQPLMLMFAFTFVLHRTGNVKGGPPGLNVPYQLFSFTGLMSWTFFTTAVSTASSSVLGDLTLLNKTYFPREVLPIGSIAQAIVNYCLAAVVLTGLFFVTGYTPKSTAPYIVPALALMVLLVIGVGMIVSALTIYFRDLRLALPIILQFGLFATPIGYNFTAIPRKLRLPYSFINPMGPIIDTLRRALLYGQHPAWIFFGAAAVSTFVVFFGGYAMFKRLEIYFTDIS
jgi:ABC-type polysaccharide/polyol phosphate export permease